MRYLLLLMLASACATPAPDFFGASRKEIRRGGIDFVVYWKGSTVEVVRRGYLTRPERVRVSRMMADAAEAATGCRVIPNSMRTKIPGDTGVARFDLDCRG